AVDPGQHAAHGAGVVEVAEGGCLVAEAGVEAALVAMVGAGGSASPAVGGGGSVSPAVGVGETLLPRGGGDVHRLVERHAVDVDAGDGDGAPAVREGAAVVQAGAAREAAVHGEASGVVVVARDHHHRHAVLAHDGLHHLIPQLQRTERGDLRVEDVAGHHDRVRSGVG